MLGHMLREARRGERRMDPYKRAQGKRYLGQPSNLKAIVEAGTTMGFTNKEVIPMQASRS